MTEIEVKEGSAVIVDPSTGEIIDLEKVDPPTLIKAVEMIKRYEEKWKLWRWAAEDEVLRRMDEAQDRLVEVEMADGRQLQVEIDARRTRQWDADELEGVLEDLVKRRRLRRIQAMGALERVWKVDGNHMKDLLESLSPRSEAHKAITACFQWVQRSRRSIKITEVDAPKKLGR